MGDWNTPEGRRVAEVVGDGHLKLHDRGWMGKSPGGWTLMRPEWIARILDGDAREWLEERCTAIEAEFDPTAGKAEAYTAWRYEGYGCEQMGDQHDTYSAALIAAVLAVLKETEDG